MSKKTLEERIQRLEDIQEIQNLMGRYSYLHTAAEHERCYEELWAKKTPGVRIQVNDQWGIFEGNDEVRKMVIDVHKHSDGADRRGRMFMHTMTTPVIEIARDGKTAKGVWISPGHETAPFGGGKLRATWAWCKYGVDFVKEDGKWRFWHLHVYGIFHNPYETSWVDLPAIPFTPKPPELSGRPSPRKDNPIMYSPNTVQELAPAPPDPYETFDEKNAY